MSLLSTRFERRALKRDNAKQPAVLTLTEGWQDRPSLPERLIEVWRSRDFLCQVFRESEDMVRASICRTTIDASSDRWMAGISWEELQLIKREIGRGHLDAVEVFPADRDVVNVANMRHLFIFDAPLPYAWRRGQ